MLLLAAHPLDIPIFREEEGVGGRNELGFLEVGEVNNVCIVVVDLEEVVRIVVVKNWLLLGENFPL